MKSLERLVFLDTESTGVSGEDRIIEIGITEVVNGRLTGNRFSSLVMTDRPIHWAAQRVHGIKSSDLKGKPYFHQISDKVLDFIGDSPAFAHNARFDQGMLTREWNAINLPHELRPKLQCTLPLASLFFSGPVGIDALMQRLLPETEKRGKHSAADDADILAKVFIKLLEMDPEAVERYICKQRNVRSDVLLKEQEQKSERQTKKMSDKLAQSARELNPGVADGIRKANTSGSIEDALAVKVGRDYITYTPADEVVKMVGPVGRELAKTLESPAHQISALRMMARGMDPALAVGRQMCYVEREKAKEVSSSFSY